MPKPLYTIGHSTHPLAEFIEILKAFQITHIIDVRSIPRSAHVPWFNEDDLRIALKQVKIGYTLLGALGGLRSTNKKSINTAWRNASFRGFADYMGTPEFFSGLKKLMHLIKNKKKVAILCAEAVPWRCHRSLIADALAVRHIPVFHIMSKTNAKEHQLTAFAKVDRTKRPIKIYYPLSKTAQRN